MITKNIETGEEYTLSITQTTTRQLSDLTITAEFHDDYDGFAFRLRCGDKTSKWVSHYEEFAELEVSGRQFRLGTAYWDDTFPAEQPFEVI